MVGEHLHLCSSSPPLGNAVVWKKACKGVHIVAVQWEAFFFLPGFAIGTAAGGGQYLGANDPKQARRAVWLCVLITAAAMGVSASCS